MKPIEQTRREFLRAAGKGVLGAAALTAIPSVLKPALAETAASPAYPWTYQQVDKDAVLKHTYDCFYSHGGCCAAVFARHHGDHGRGLWRALQRAQRQDVRQWRGWLRCGLAVRLAGGACAVIGLFCEAEDARALRDQLYEWYKVEPFPTYQPEIESVTTVANSVLCADSVGAYMEATGYAMSDPGRLARCAGLSAEVAVKTIELLNIHFGFEAAPVVEEAPAEEEETLGENEYIGVGTSEIGGEIKVKVTMDGDKIAKIEVLSHNETAGIADPALEQIPEAIIAAQSTSVDAITGATKTSEALIAAVNDALSQIK